MIKVFKVLGLCLLYSITLFISFMGYGCSCNDALSLYSANSKQASFSVHYLDVNHGDCVLICFPDGKTVMIDGGKFSASTFTKITNYFKEYDVDKIDYYIVTQPDVEHIGNMLNVVKKVEIGKVYAPLISKLDYFASYKKVVNKLVEKNIPIVISELGQVIEGENYKLYFLSPLSTDIKESSYNLLKESKEITEYLVNGISPILYLEYNGVAFTFSGDANNQEEKRVAEYIKTGFYKTYFGSQFEIGEVDYYMVSNHGDKACNDMDLLRILRPKNTIISVGGENLDSLPSTETIKRINSVKVEANIFRTDTCGTISVFVDELGKQSIALEGMR